MRVLVVALLLFRAGHALAEPPVALIVNLSEQDASAPLVATMHKDLAIAGYSLDSDPALREQLLQPRPAATDWSEEKLALAAAQTAYESFELGAALASLESFDRSWREKPPTDLGRDLLAQRYLLGGLVRFAQNNESKARDNFRLSHRLRPSQVELSAGHYRPAVVALYAGAVQDNLSAAQLPFIATYEPEGAQLYVDGLMHRAGASISAGPHLIRLRAPGFRSDVSVVFVTAKSQFEAKLKPLARKEALAALHAQVAREPANRGLGVLASERGAALIVLLRQDGDRPQAAVFRTDAGERGPWLLVGTQTWSFALRRDTPSDGASESAPLLVTSTGKAWYRTWWGGGMLAVGTGAAIGSALYFLLSASAGDDEGVTIDRWCIGSC